MPRVIKTSQSQTYLTASSTAHCPESLLPASGPQPPPQRRSKVSIAHGGNASSSPRAVRSPRAISRPKLTASYSVPRVSSAPAGSHPSVPEGKPMTRSSSVASGSNNGWENSNDVHSPTTPPVRNVRRTSSSQYRAAEPGRGQLLPTKSSEAIPIDGLHGSGNRGRSMSTSTLSSWNAKLPARAQSFVTKTLRSRGRRTTSTGNNDNSNHDYIHHSSSNLDLSGHPPHSRRPNNSPCPPSPYPRSEYSSSHGKQPRSFYSSRWWLWSWRSVGKPSASNHLQMIQTVVVFLVIFLVWGSYRRALATSEQFAKFKHDQSLVQLHLRKLVGTSIHLHEQLNQLSAESKDVVENASGSNGQRANRVPVDSELIRAQMQQLKHTENELQRELDGLETKLQHSARLSIVDVFGEGPIQITLDLDFGNIVDYKDERIVLSLWYDTPYAAWVLIQQVRAGVWNHATFQLDRGMAISAVPQAKELAEDYNRLDFVESAHDKHESWTVGLADSGDGAFRLFINLQDNGEAHKRDVCVGKVIEGFGSLQRLVATTRKFDGTDLVVTIKSATAARLAPQRGQPAGGF